MIAPITPKDLKKRHEQNVANLLRKLDEGKTLTNQQLEYLANATHAHPADHQSRMAILAEGLPDDLATQLSERDTTAERGRSIIEMRGLLAMALQQGDVRAALDARKELNRLQGLYKQSKGDSLIDSLKQAMAAD